MAFFANNIGYWLQTSYFDYEAFNPLLNLWSLAVELQFYLLFPLIYPLFHQSKRALIFGLLVSLVVALLVTTVSPKTSFFLLPFRLWEFLFGVAAATLSEKVGGIHSRFSSIVLLAAILGVLAVPLDPTNPSALYGHVGLISFYASAITAVILVKPLANLGVLWGVPWRTFTYLGGLSYSIYLVHFPLMVLWNYEAFGGTVLGTQNYTNLIFLGAIIGVLSFGLHRSAETIRYKTFNFRIAALGCLFSFICVLSSFPLNKVFYNEMELKVFNAWFDRSEYRCGKLFRLMNPTSTFCNIGANEGRSVLFLIGNSHADAIKRVVGDIGSNNASEVYFYVGNRPLMVGSTKSSEIVNDVLQKKADRVLFHYSSSLYDSAEQQNELVLAINQLSELGVKIYLLAPVPEYDFHVPRSIWTALEQGDPAPVGHSIQNYETQLLPFNFMVQALSGKSDVNVLSPVHSLCPEQVCRLQIDGKPLYFDAGHLTLTGAEELRTLISDIFMNFK